MIMASTSEDDRFTFGLIVDIIDVLEQHGFSRPIEDRDAVLGRTLGVLFELTETFEGRRDVLGAVITST
jgi:hypothetical protein